MERLIQIVTSVVFAAHALLGCGVHYSCRHNPAREICSATQHVHHDCGGHHEGQSHESSDEGLPEAPCQHVSCSFVKAETVRVDQGVGHVEWIAAAAMLVEPAATPQVFLTANEPLCAADLTSTPLFVWHCALVI
jgi:hypothetical protein